MSASGQRVANEPGRSISHHGRLARPGLSSRKPRPSRHSPSPAVTAGREPACPSPPAAAHLQDLLGLSEEGLPTVLDADPLAVTPGDLEQAGFPSCSRRRRSARRPRSAARPLDLLLAPGAFEDALATLAQRLHPAILKPAMTLVSSPLPLALRASTLRRSSGPRPSGRVTWRCARRDLRVLTWAEYTERVERIAAGLQALGVERGDTVALMLLNRPEFHRVDAAAPHAGAIPFSVYNTLRSSRRTRSSTTCGRSCRSPSARRRRWVAAAARAQPTLRHVVPHRRPRAQRDVARGSASRNAAARAFDLRAAGRRTPTTWPTLVYTSGTGAEGRGVSPTPTCSPRPAPPRSASRSQRRLDRLLPAAAHIVDRWQSHYHGSLGLGCTVTCVADPRQVLAVLPDARPTLVRAASPACGESSRARIFTTWGARPSRSGSRSGSATCAGSRAARRPSRPRARVLGPPAPRRRDLGRPAGPGLEPTARDRDGTCGLPVRAWSCASRPTASCSSAARWSCAATTGSSSAPGARSPRTAGCGRATSPRWTRTATSPSSRPQEGHHHLLGGQATWPCGIERTLAGGDPRIAAVVVMIRIRRPYSIALVVLEPKADDDPEVRRGGRARSPRQPAARARRAGEALDDPPGPRRRRRDHRDGQAAARRDRGEVC